MPDLSRNKNIKGSHKVTENRNLQHAWHCFEGEFTWLLEHLRSSFLLPE